MTDQPGAATLKKADEPAPKEKDPKQSVAQALEIVTCARDVISRGGCSVFWGEPMCSSSFQASWLVPPWSGPLRVPIVATRPDNILGPLMFELAAFEGRSVKASENVAADDREATVNVIWGLVTSPGTKANLGALRYGKSPCVGLSVAPWPDISRKASCRADC
jgi:hypothetical protein